MPICTAKPSQFAAAFTTIFDFSELTVCIANAGSGEHFFPAPSKGIGDARNTEAIFSGRFLGNLVDVLTGERNIRAKAFTDLLLHTRHGDRTKIGEIGR